VRVTLEPLIRKTAAQIICKPLPEIEVDPVLLNNYSRICLPTHQYHRRGESPVVGFQAGPSEGWQFAVKDNGQGIPHHLQDGIFEPRSACMAAILGTGWDWLCAARSSPAMAGASGRVRRRVQGHLSLYLVREPGVAFRQTLDRCVLNDMAF
jgi:hypothetical protein